MSDYQNCSWCELEDGGYLLEDVCLGDKTLSAVYLGSSGVFVILPSLDDAKALYPSIRGILGSVRVFIYLSDVGAYYDPKSGLADKQAVNEELEAEIGECIYSELYTFSESRLLRMKDNLIEKDAYSRGYYTSSDGELYLLKGKVFRAASDFDPDLVYHCTLYGGIFGVHRFMMGKYFSGFIYFLTCGGFFAGWALDLLQQFLGIYKDKQERLLLPLENKRRKAIELIPGIFVSIFCLTLYFRLWGVSLQGGIAALGSSSGGFGNVVSGVLGSFFGI